WDWDDDKVRLLKKKLAAVDVFDETQADKAAVSPWYALGSMIYLFWMIVIASGVLLILWYLPNTSRAYDSILRIQHEVPLGWLVRGIHKYGADAIIIATTLRIYRLYFTGEYKTRELAWVIAIVTLIVGMFSGLTGYLLMWNQRAFWASKVFATFPTYLDDIPGVSYTHFGMTQAQFMLGGTAIGEATMTRFYAGHFALSFISLIFVEAYFIRKGYRRIALGWGGIAICFLMLASVAAFLPVELGSRANRAETPLPILSDWYFLGLYQMMKEMKPFWAVIGTIFIPAIALAMPLLDRAKDVPTWRRPFFFCFGLTALIHWLAMSFMIMSDYAVISTDPPRLWASFALVCLASGCFEFKAMGFPRKALIKRVGGLVVMWAALYLVFAGWTRFRLPEYAGTYYLWGKTNFVIEPDATKRDLHNSLFRGDPKAQNQTIANTVHALRWSWVNEWYEADADQVRRIQQAHNSVRGWWILMTVIMLGSAALTVGTTPPGGVESLIYPRWWRCCRCRAASTSAISGRRTSPSRWRWRASRGRPCWRGRCSS
ncbi:MAG: cytochrome bc complex cytochrome b subunit, partial [Armatimonadetes bacterium]|nr:cytochrome bc complex cytochrome b subunit [Armatimonadota bacterium]